MDKYTIKLDRNVLRQLGSQLYGDTPSVIAELVANSYDADARNVWITVDTENNNVIVEDDGKGMSVADINNSFLNIGYDKREGHETTALGRRIMGRKGIGKLAAFSLTNCVSVCSIKENTKCGCIMDFLKIIDGEEPVGIDPASIFFDVSRLSNCGSGTRIELIGVKKRVALSYRFIVNKLIRTFDVNDKDFTIHIRQNNSEYKSLCRTNLNFTSIMDTILVVGNEYSEMITEIQKNSIDSKYKTAITYDEYVNSQNSNIQNQLKRFPYNLVCEDIHGSEVTISFSLSGWIGTVESLPKLHKLTETLIVSSEDDEDRISVSDNRISLFSRGKLGEYDILPKIKTNRNYEPYVIGEFNIDVFEDDSLADMAISNRRGYDEGDSRYIEAIKIIKRLLRFIIDQKSDISKRQQKDKEIIEAQQIMENLPQKSRSKIIFENSLTPEERSVVEQENFQFTRAITSNRATKKVFISHNSKLKIYGQFIVDVLEDYGIDVQSTIIFTSDRRLGVPQGRDIYDYLKECFREELMVIFLFSKAFYDSNICVSEAGAAWATNQNCLNAIVDIDFNEIEKPSNNALSSIKLMNLHNEDQQITLAEFFTAIIESGLHMCADQVRLTASIKKMIDSEKYSDEKMDNPTIFIPTRKFLPTPICPECGNTMRIIQKEGQPLFECINVLCKKTMVLKIE